MCSILLRPLGHFVPVLRRVAPVAAGIACLWLAAPSPALSEPFSLREWEAERVDPDSARERRNLPTVSPFYGGSLERPFDEEQWRESRRFGESGDRQEIPTGFIASIGRFGLQIDSTGDGPRIGGLAWSPSDSVSIVAGGNLGDSDGIGASLSVRIGF